MKRIFALKTRMSTYIRVLFFGVVLLCSAVVTQAQAVRLTKFAEYTINPAASGHKTVSFPRVFYHEGRQKIYTLYTGIKTTSTGRSPQDQSIGWLEYDSTFTPTGKAGVLAEPTTGGDIAVAFDGASYYLLIGGPGGYVLYKYADDFSLTQKVTIRLNTFDTQNDQLLNYTGGKLYCAALTGDAASMMNPNAPVGQRWFVYSTNLVQERDTIMRGESYIATGGSIIFADKTLHVVTADKFSGSSLYVYQYSESFQYLGKKQLTTDGQWSQGLLYDSGYYYVAYHTGGHGAGNVAVGVFDKNWVNITTQAVSNYTSSPGKAGFNAQRPWLMKRGNRLYVAYDVASYNETIQENPDWQGKVVAYTITTSPTDIRTEWFSSEPNMQVFPHPLTGNPATVHFTLSKPERISLKLFNALGQEMSQILDETLPAGKYEKSLDIGNWSLVNGAYFLQLQTNDQKLQTIPLQVIR